MIKPVNNYILIELLKVDSFIPTEKGIYEEIGIVKAISKGVEGFVEIGQKVFFDSWLAGKYPIGKDEECFWLVRWEDVRAIEKQEK